MDIIPTFDQATQLSRARRGPGLPSGPRPFGPAGGGGSGPTGKEILGILRKRLSMILIVLLSVTTFTIIATLLWWLFAPSYNALAIIEVRPPAEQLTGAPRLYSKDIMDRIMLSHARIVKSPHILSNVAKNVEVQKTRWFRKDDETAAIKRLDEDISIRAIPNTNYIEISLSDQAASESERRDLATIVNTLANTFVEQSRITLRGERRADIGELDEQLGTFQAELERARRDAQIAREASDIPNLQERQNVLSVQLQTLITQLTRFEIARARTRSELDGIRKQQADGSIATAPEVIAALEADPTLRALRNTEIGFVSNRDNLVRKFGPRHRQILDLETRLESIRREIATKDEELTRRAIALLISEREIALTSTIAMILEVQENLEEANAKAADLQNIITRLENTQARKQNLEARIRELEDRIMEVRLLERGEQQVLLRVPAITPREISMPKWKVMVPLGIFLGVGLGIGLAFLLEFIDTSIKSPSDVSRRVDLPMLGVIPHTDDLEEKIEDLRLAFMTNPDSLISEAFRQIRTCLLFSGPASQRRTLLVASPLPQDGRTTVAMNLAAAIAQDGRRVLVIDANFRQPAIRELFPKCAEGGLSSALVGQADWGKMLHEVIPNLHVLPAGVMPPNPAELLGSDEMRKILAEITEQYEQVIIDGAPALVVTDSCVLATLVDGVIMTVRAGANTYGIVQRARDMFLRVGAHFVGVVLNGVRVSAGGYLRESYDTFYEYHEQSKLPSAEPPGTS